MERVVELWRETLGDLALASLDPRATCKPTIDADDLDVGPSPTLAPADPPTAIGVAAHISATNTLRPTDDGGVADGRAEAYRIGPELGQGGMAVVYRAHQTQLGRDVALKIAHDAAFAAQRRRFVAEARVTGALDHPNVVPVHDLVETPDGRLALAMKLVEGEPWSRSLGKRPLHEDVAVLVDVCNAVAFAHRRGFVHADLKPENVMLGEFGEVVVMDWGCAVSVGPLAAGARPITRRPEDIRRPFGSPAYMPPELALGQGRRIGPATDVYLLGAILYELLAGRPPHLRASAAETLEAAALSDPDALPADAPAALRDVVTRAMERRSEARFPAALDVRDALTAWLETRRSRLLSDDARATLAACERNGGADRGALYLELESALSGFRQARLLWPGNAEAEAGEQTARALVVDTALRFGDLGLAEAHVARVPPGADRDALDARIRRARADASAAATSARRARMAAWGGALAVLAVGAIGFTAVNAERRHAEAEAALATARLAEIEQLSDVEKLDEASAAREALWPALPAEIPELQRWLADAGALVARLPLHQATLAALRSHGVRDGDRWRFDDATSQWQHDTLARLVDGLATLEAEGIPDVRHRLDFASTLAQKSLVDGRDAWDRAIAGIAASPRYGGLRIAPQLGLVPLGPDPDSGLYEFAHLATGDVPARSADGKLVRAEGMGVVLVLLPGGTFAMGASRDGANRDPAATAAEGPPTQVTLSPFFLAKYEFTQDQWIRATGRNPSAYAPGRDIGGHVHTALHPVEQVNWFEARDTLARLALTLPTEAQWEYADRAGTTTVYWTGDDVSSLQGAANLADRWGRDHGGPGSWVWEPGLDDGYLAHAPVGSFRANAFGLHDTIGNVWEWCLDGMGAYTLPTAAGDGARQVPADAPHLFRGGGFRANRDHARSADRYPLPSTDFKGFDIGLRAARPVDPDPAATSSESAR